MRGVRIATAALGLLLAGASAALGLGRGDVAPDFALRAFDGGSLRLADYRGKLVLLNFWASWCGPCLAEMPRLSAWQRRYGGAGLQVLGVSMDDEAAAAERLLAKRPLDYPNALGDAQLGERYGGILGLPQSFLIDRSGVILARYKGDADLAQIETAIRSQLDASPPSAPAAAVTAAAPAPERESAGAALVLEINGPIGPATSSYIVRGIESARYRHARLVVLEIDTPGGLDSAMREIIRAILASPVPVASYVAPSGARAASAGTYILYASPIAAMAPATNLGAATPVSIGGGEPEAPAPAAPGAAGKPAEKGAGEGGAAPQNGPGTTMERKVTNDAVAYIRGLAELRGRNADWAEQAVRGAASLSANAALEQHVIDLIARDLPDLLARIDGREVRLNGESVKLATRELTVLKVKPDWRTELLAVITNPTVAYGLMLIGVWGLLLEGYNPGAVLPGVVGSICLLVALFAFQVLSVNYAGLALLVLGAGMIVAEFFFPAYGSLGAGGVIAFVVGSLILFDANVPGMSIARSLIAGIATAGALVIAGIVYLATRSYRRPVATGAQAMIGDVVEVTEDFSGRGRVRYGGELWNARSQAALHAGETARIVKVEGLTLWIEPA